MTLTRGKHIIGGLWLIAFLILFILMTIQTVNGNVYQNRAQEAWEWFTPNILPTLGVILGVFISDWQNNSTPADEISVSKGLVAISFILSLVHVTILLIVVITASQKPTVETTFQALKSANLPLGAIQGLVTLTLGIFFKKS